MSEDRNIRELYMNEMDQVSGGAQGFCSTDVRLSEDKTRGYCDKCMCDWLLEYANQSADVLP